MTMMRWGRGLLLWGLVGVLLSVAPAVLLAMLPPAFAEGFIGLLAALLTLSLTPLMALVAVLGALLWLVARLRGDRF
jgi:hypothetical protein